MAPNPKKTTLYAVPIGHTPGIYFDWPSCQKATSKFPGSIYKKFVNLEEACFFMDVNGVNHANIRMFELCNDSNISTSLGEFCSRYSLPVPMPPETPLCISPQPDSQVKVHEPSNQPTSCSCKSADDDFMIRCNVCRTWMHYGCTQLPPYQLYIFHSTTRMYQCSLCTSIPDNFHTLGMEDKFISSTSQYSQTDYTMSDKHTMTDPSIDIASKSVRPPHNECRAMLREMESSLVEKLLSVNRENAGIKHEILEKELTSMRKDLNESLATIKRKDERIANLESNLGKLSGNRLSNIEAKLASLEKTSSKLCAHNPDINAKLSVLTEKLQESTNRMHDLSTSVMKANDTSEKLQKELDGLRKEINHIASVPQNTTEKPLNHNLNRPLKSISNTTVRSYSDVVSHNERKPPEIPVSPKVSPMTSDPQLNTQGTPVINEELCTKPRPSEGTWVGDHLDILVIGNSHTSKLVPKKLFRGLRTKIETLRSKTIEGAIEFIKSCSLPHPSAIILQVFDNTLYTSSLTMATELMEVLIQSCRDKFPSSKLCATEVLPRIYPSTDETAKYSKKAEDFNKCLLQRSDVSVIPLLGLQSVTSKHFTSDNVHLNYEGRVLLVDSYRHVINPLLNLDPSKSIPIDEDPQAQPIRNRRNTGLSQYKQYDEHRSQPHQDEHLQQHAGRQQHQNGHQRHLNRYQRHQDDQVQQHAGHQQHQNEHQRHLNRHQRHQDDQVQQHAGLHQHQNEHQRHQYEHLRHQYDHHRQQFEHPRHGSEHLQHQNDYGNWSLPPRLPAEPYHSNDNYRPPHQHHSSSSSDILKRLSDFFTSLNA